MKTPLNRREFAKRLAAGTGAFAAGGLAHGQERVNPENKQPVVGADGTVRGAKPPQFGHVRTSGTLQGNGSFLETQREIPVKGDFDVIVCGGGPAGFTAALAAARTGAKTMLLEVNGCVGGVWTAGMLSWIIDAKNKGGIMKELVTRLEEQAIGRYVTSSFVYHPDEMKVLLEQMLLDAGVRIRIHTRVVGAAVDQNRVTAVLTESKSGRECWTAKNFIDCSGDGDLAAQAGCEFEFGRPGDGITQPMSLMVLLTGVTSEGITPYVRGLAEPAGKGNPKQNLLEEFRRGGIDPSYGGPTIFEIREGLYAVMINHQYGVSAIDADDVTTATLQARNEVHQLIGALRKLGGPWKSAELVTTGEQIGTREGRRILGRYYTGSEDLKNGARLEDGICPVTFGIDVHSTDPKQTKGIESKPFKSRPYDISLRALLARDVDGLMMAGRCISGDFIAHSSYRVTGNAVVMGEAAGITSALAAANRTLPHEVPYEEVRKGMGLAAAS